MRKGTLQNKPPYSLGSVDKVLQLMQVLRDTGSLRLVDAAAELGISPSTAHRLLSMLVYRGFAIQDDSRVYLPGPAMAERPVLASSTLMLKKLVQPHLEALTARTGETANLMIRVGASVRFLSTVESTQLLRVSDRRGAVLPASRASGGKALLAELDPESLGRLFRVPSNRLPDEEFTALRAELENVRRQGFAANFEGTEDGVCAIGVAIHDETGGGLAAISVSLPASRLSESVRLGLIDSVLSARADIEADLVAHPLD